MRHPTTNPLAFFVHALLSLFTGALGAGGAAAIQLVGNGTASLSVILTGGLGMFFAYFGAGFVMLEKSPETAAALNDAGQQLLARVDALQQSHSGLAAQLGQALGHLRQISALLNTPPTTIGQALVPQPAGQIVSTGIAAVTQPPAGWQTTNVQVPQQAFPAPLDWTGLQQAVTPQPPRG